MKSIGPSRAAHFALGAQWEACWNVVRPLLNWEERDK